MSKLVYFRSGHAEITIPFPHNPFDMICGSSTLFVSDKKDKNTNATTYAYKIKSLLDVCEVANEVVNTHGMLGSPDDPVVGIHTQRSFHQIMDWANKLYPHESHALNQLFNFNVDLVEWIYSRCTLSLEERIYCNMQRVADLFGIPVTEDDYTPAGEPLLLHKIVQALKGET